MSESLLDTLRTLSTFCIFFILPGDLSCDLRASSPLYPFDYERSFQSSLPDLTYFRLWFFKMSVNSKLTYTAPPRTPEQEAAEMATLYILFIIGTGFVILLYILYNIGKYWTPISGFIKYCWTPFAVLFAYLANSSRVWDWLRCLDRYLVCFLML